jgi:CHASE3 domain sensor protein
MDDDATAAAWNQAEQDERRQREEAALARCRKLMDELRQIVNELEEQSEWT